MPGILYVKLASVPRRKEKSDVETLRALWFRKYVVKWLLRQWLVILKEKYSLEQENYLKFLFIRLIFEYLNY